MKELKTHNHLLNKSAKASSNTADYRLIIAYCQAVVQSLRRYQLLKEDGTGSEGQHHEDSSHNKRYLLHSDLTSMLKLMYKRHPGGLDSPGG